MTEQWKPIGDEWPQPAMVMVTRNYANAVIVACSSNLSGYFVPKYCLHPMPPTITPEQQAVLDAAIRQNTIAHSALHSHDQYLTACYTTDRAVDDMLAAQQPPDPMKELRQARKEEQDALLKYLHEVERGIDTSSAGSLRDYDQASKRVEAAIAALEAKS